MSSLLLIRHCKCSGNPEKSFITFSWCFIFPSQLMSFLMITCRTSSKTMHKFQEILSSMQCALSPFVSNCHLNQNKYCCQFVLHTIPGSSNYFHHLDLLLRKMLRCQNDAANTLQYYGFLAVALVCGKYAVMASIALMNCVAGLYGKIPVKLD